MAVQHLSSINGEFVFLGTAAGMVNISREVVITGDNEPAFYGRYVASRDKAPTMLIVGDTQDEVVAAAFATISKFLDRMHTFGFRTAS